MNQGLSEKLKNLINTSNVLTSGERAEWLALLDLMDDKQAGELEKILDAPAKATEDRQESSVKKEMVKPVEKKMPVGGQILNQPGTSSVVRPAQPLPAAASASLKHLPQLSHIMNVPHLGASVANVQPQTAKETLARSNVAGANINLAKSSENKTKSVFASKLQKILAEEELAAGKEEYPLELTSGHAKKPAPLGSLKVEEKPKPQIAKLPPLEIKKPVPTAMPQKLAQHLVAEAVKLPAKPLLKPEIKLGEKSGIGAQIPKQFVLDKKPASLGASVHTELKILGLVDLEQLVPEVLNSSDQEMLIKKIKALVQKLGYHDVIFSLEKSEAFKQYINTGLEILSKDTNFEKLTESDTQGRFLNRSQFEKITDLLRNIQAV